MPSPWRRRTGKSKNAVMGTASCCVYSCPASRRSRTVRATSFIQGWRAQWAASKRSTSGNWASDAPTMSWPCANMRRCRSGKVKFAVQPSAARTWPAITSTATRLPPARSVLDTRASKASTSAGGRLTSSRPLLTALK
ncbi:hypothetical protein G6F31_020221 [Rhizopus arrhizus]|nr:hypothetical protein G6F31_020221 [Rhizopus arrhizus]